MINEDRLADIEQAYHESTTRLHRVTVRVHYSGCMDFIFEDFTLEEAIEMAKAEFNEERKSTYLNLSIDMIEG